MKIINYITRIFFMLILAMTPWACDDEVEEDPCLKTKWPQPKELEIKLAVKILDSNPVLSGGAPGSQYPADFQKMVVKGTIKKVDCDNDSIAPVSIGNTYITKGIDVPANLYVQNAYWIGHVVYVYEFGNSKDYLDIKLTVTITMEDNKSYTCNVTHKVYYEEIGQMAGDLFYFVLLEIYSENWIKI